MSIDNSELRKQATRLFTSDLTKKLLDSIFDEKSGFNKDTMEVIVLDNGKIVEEGSHEELMGIAGGKYKTAFELQRKGYE